MGGSSIGQFLYDDGGQRLRTQYNTLENGQPATQTHAQHSLYQGLKLISQYDVSENNSLSLNANYQFAGSMSIGRRAYNEDDTANNTQTYYHTDSLGSVLATSKANKSIAARYDYDAWGKELNNTDTSDNPIGYTGHQMDRESENKTGLIYANARYLDPDTGRFLSFDPFEGYDDKPISLHRYMYAYQNPVRYTDPTGNYAELPLEIASIGIGLYSAASNYLDGNTDAALEDLAYVGADIALAVVPGAPGGLGMARQIAKEGAEAVTDAKKLDNVADTASSAKSATKTTKESSVSPNSTTTTPAERLAKKSEKYGGEELRNILAKNIKDTRGRSQGKSKTARENSLREAKGEVDGFHKMKSEGYELQDIDIKYNGNQGLDQVYKHKKTGDYSINEAKHGKGLGKLVKSGKSGKSGKRMRQGSQPYNLDRLTKFRKQDSSGATDDLFDDMREGLVKSYTTSYKGKSMHEILSEARLPNMRDSNSIKRIK